MTRVVLTISTALLLLCTAATAQAKPIVGIGEQRPEMFIDQHWIDLAKPDVRYVIPWDALTRKQDRAAADWFLPWARDAHARVLLSFGHSNKRHRELKMPTRSQFRKQFKAIQARYPWVTQFQAWNEANHGTQPTFNKPKRAAMAYDVIKGACPKCTVSAPSVLDDGMKTVNYLKALRQGRQEEGHDLEPAQPHRRQPRTAREQEHHKLILRHTHGQLWFTETGGIYNRWIPKKSNGSLKHIKQYNAGERQASDQEHLQARSPELRASSASTTTTGSRPSRRSRAGLRAVQLHRKAALALQHLQGTGAEVRSISHSASASSAVVAQ